MDWIIPLIIVLPITYVVLIIAHYIALYFIMWMRWDETDWFQDNIFNRENRYDNKK